MNINRRAPAAVRGLALSCALAACIPMPSLAHGDHDRHCEHHDRDRDHRRDRSEGDKVIGTVGSADGTPLAHARVVLTGGGRAYETASDRHGRFELHHVAAGTYQVYVAAPGYAALSERAVAVQGRTDLHFDLSTATTSALTVIGSVNSSNAPSISTASGPSVTLDAQQSAARGATAVSALLWNQLATTPVLPLGGGNNAPVSFAVRGPDPSETLVDVDGHQVNNGNTGDFDLSLIDPAALQSVQVVYGIAPSSLLGPDTLGGAIDLVTLDPSASPQSLIRGFAGSFGSTGQTLQTTGSDGRFGYALSLHRVTSLGSVNQNVVGADSGRSTTVGSAFFGESLLSKLRYQLGDGFGYVQLAVRNQASNADLSALLTNVTPPNAYQSFAGTWSAAQQSGYGLDAVVPLGSYGKRAPPDTTLTFSHLTTLALQSVTGPGAQTSPYLYDQRDLLGDDWLLLDHRFAKGDLSLKYDLATEGLTTQYVPGSQHADAVTVGAGPPAGDPAAAAAALPLAQTQRSAVIRYSADPSSHVHYSLAAYQSDFSVFGQHFDPRAGFVWTPTARTALRASVGTTFQSPQLTSLYVPPALPAPVGGVISVGNPNLRPDFATEYDLGLEQLVGPPASATRLSLDVYRSNLRQPTQVLVPALVPGCEKHGDCPISRPVNAGDGVYSGVELRGEHAFGQQYRLRFGWDVDSSYLTAIPADVQDGTLVEGEQTLGQPLHKAYLGFARDVANGWNYGADLDYEGAYNELNRPAFAALAAHLAYRRGGFEIGVYGTNLTGVYADPFTITGGGVPYGAEPGVPMVATDAYTLVGPKIVVVATRRL